MLTGQVPEALLEGLVFMLSRTVMAATRLGIFEALAERPDDGAGVASRLGLDAEGTSTLLTALHAMGYLQWKNGLYRNSRKTNRNLLRSSKAPFTDAVGSFAYDIWDYFGHLEETLRTGRPVGLHDWPADDPSWERYMRGLFDFARHGADFITRLIPAKDPRRMLELAGGHGAYSMEMCRKHPELRATIVDLEGAARIGERIVSEQGYSDQVSYQVGDMFEVELDDDYDVAVAAQIVHHFDEEGCVTLLRRAHGALRSGGTMAIIEPERPEEGKRGQDVGVLTGVLFYISSHIRTYTGAELEAFMRQAGFSSVRSRRNLRFPGVVVVTGNA